MKGVRSVSQNWRKPRLTIRLRARFTRLRKHAGLTQQRLAKLVGTTTSVICRLEDADYQGHSLAMLRRIADALNKRVELRFVNVKRKPKVA